MNDPVTTDRLRQEAQDDRQSLQCEALPRDHWLKLAKDRIRNFSDEDLADQFRALEDNELAAIARTILMLVTDWTPEYVSSGRADEEAPVIAAALFALLEQQADLVFELYCWGELQEELDF